MTVPAFHAVPLWGGSGAQARPGWSAAGSPPLPAGWTNVLGFPLPAIPGWTVPQHGAAPPAAPAATSGGGSCGDVTVGGVTIPLDCAGPGWGLVPGAARAVIGRSWFRNGKGFAGASALPAVVNHRQNDTEGPVRAQGRVGACTAFSFATAVDHEIARATGRPGAVSALHVWSRYHRPVMESAAVGNRGRAVASEASWPYDERRACSWYQYCREGCGPSLGVSCREPDAGEVSAADARADVDITRVTRLDETDMDELKEVLAKGRDVWFSMFVDRRFESLERGAVVRDLDYVRRSGHAMVLAGYQTEPDGTYFLVHNSWGRDWGDGGYAWIHERTLARNVIGAFLVDARPAGGVQPTPPAAPKPPAPPPEPERKETTCAGDLTPDSVTGECVPPCADGSPRAGSVCPVESQCAPGEVNLFGLCVPAPRRQRSADPSTGIRWMCGASGCTYIVPGGQAGCRFAACMVSCAAPRYVLVSGPNGLSCSE